MRRAMTGSLPQCPLKFSNRLWRGLMLTKFKNKVIPVNVMPKGNFFSLLHFEFKKKKFFGPP